MHSGWTDRQDRWSADADGWFGGIGRFGGRFAPEAFSATLDELAVAWRAAQADREFGCELQRLLTERAHAPSPLHEAERLSDRVGARVLLKREDLLHTGSYKIRNALGQALLARRMGKTRVLAETGAGLHGVAVASVAAALGLSCTVYMGAADMDRQRFNLERMRFFGADVVPVHTGGATLGHAVNHALQDWVSSLESTAFVFGTASGPHPYPTVLQSFVREIGDEARRQCHAQIGQLPDAVVACVGGGVNATGLFTAFLDDPHVRLHVVEAGGNGSDSGEHASTLERGSVGVFHGCRTYLLQDCDGQTARTRSAAAGLDYPAVGPQLALLTDIGRVRVAAVSDHDATAAMRLLAETEGILGSLESAHAVAGAMNLAADLPGQTVLVGLSGHGDKDVAGVGNGGHGCCASESPDLTAPRDRRRA